MSETKELGILVTGDVSDVESALNSLLDKLGDFKDTIFNVDANTDEADSQIDNLKSTIDQISGDTFEVTIDAEDDASSVVDAISAKLDELQGDNANIIITGEDDAASVIEQVKSELETLPSQVDINITATDNASGPISEASGATNDLTTAATATTAVGLDVWLYKMITGAGQYEDSVMAMGTATKDSGTTAEQVMSNWEGSISNMTASTSRGAGDARNHITLMGLAGVTAREQMVSLFADASTAAAADPLHKSLDSVDAGLYNLIRGVPPSSRSLRTLGISINDLEAATGRTAAEWSKDWDKMTEDQRAAVLHQAMYYKYGEKEGTLYQQSFQHSTDEVGRSFEYLLRKLGDPILDTVKGGLHGLSDIVKGLGDNFNKLPGSIQFVLSSIIGLAAGVTSILSVLKIFDSTIGKIFGTDLAGKMWRGMKLDTVTEKIKGELKKWFNIDDINPGMEGIKTRVSKFIDDIKGIFSKLGEKKGTFDMVFNDETGRWEVEEGKIKGFVDRVKAKLEELKGKFKFSDIFGDEKGTVNLDEPLNKVVSFVDKAKTKLGELKGSINFKEWFKTDFDAGQLIDDIVTKIRGNIPKITNVGKELGGNLVRSIIGAIDLTAFPVLLMQILWDAGDVIRNPQNWGFTAQNNMWLIKMFFPDEANLQERMAQKVEEIVQTPFRNALTWIRDETNKLQPYNLVTKLLGLGGDDKEGEKDSLDTGLEIIRNKIKGFAEWIGTIKVPSLIDLLQGKVGGQQGQQGGEQQDPLTTWINDTKNKISGFVNEVKAKIEELKGALNIDWGAAKGNLEEIKQWINDRWNELKTWVNDRVNEIKALLPISWTDIENGLDGAVQWVKDQWDGLKTFMEGLPDKMYEIGKVIVDRMSQGVRDAIPGLNEALQIVREHWPSSPAKRGPLSSLTPEGVSEYGATLGNAMYQGVKNAMLQGTEHYYYGPNGEIQISLMEQQGFDKSKDASHAGTDATRNYPDAITYGQNSGGPSWEDSLMNDLQSQLGGSIEGLDGLTESAGGASAALADVTTQGAHAALGGVDQLDKSSAKAALGWVQATDTVKAALGGVSGESKAHPALAAVVSGTPLTGAKPGLGGVNINVDVHENAVKVDATDTTHKAGLGGATGKRIGKGLGQAIADEIGVSVKNRGITITRW